jgi:hypothetical protein
LEIVQTVVCNGFSSQRLWPIVGLDVSVLFLWDKLGCFITTIDNISVIEWHLVLEKLDIIDKVRLIRPVLEVSHRQKALV